MPGAEEPAQKKGRQKVTAMGAEKFVAGGNSGHDELGT